MQVSLARAACGGASSIPMTTCSYVPSEGDERPWGVVGRPLRLIPLRGFEFAEGSGVESPQRVVVVGGGVSGLATAYFLSRAPGLPPAVRVVEAAGRVGGNVRTERVAGHDVDVGPDSLLVPSHPLSALIDELGLADAVVSPGVVGAYVWSRGRLRPLPAGTVAGVPLRPGPLLRSGLLSPWGVVRAGLDLVLPRRPVGEDPSIGELVRGRFGRQVLDRLADPLLGGIHAGPADRLSARSIVPDLEVASRGSRSLWWGLRRLRRPALPGPSLVTLRGGLTRLTAALAQGLGDAQVITGQPVTTLEVTADGYRLRLADGAVLDADAVVLAVPTFVAATLLADVSPEAAAALREILYADVATVTLAYPRAALGRAMDRTGFLVPPEEGLLVVGCTWLPAKWPHLDDRSQVLIRAMVGRYGDRRFAVLDDVTLVAQVHDELARMMGMSGPPLNALVQRWPRAIPQYSVGHSVRLQRVDAALARLPGLHVTGAGYRGVGISGCVAQAEQSARAVLAAPARSVEGSSA